ncbi:DUF4386 family protein [Lacrimispora sp. AGF001]|uniref:DUF4386 family protein n=1 Tax=Lacrimispora sp. AGF001 TaxID=3401631 RepID=UPI003B4384F5
MTNIVFQKSSGIFIIIVAIGFTLSQIGITKFFNYPEILRQPAQNVLRAYYDKKGKIKPCWVIFSLSSLMLTAISGIFYRLLNTNNTPYLIIGTFFGTAASIFYVIGLMRWVFLADTISSKYMTVNASEKEKDNLIIIFEAFHVYCGNSIGETMGFLCMGLWIIMVGFAITATTILPWEIGLLYIACGFGIGIAPMEWTGFKAANKINKISMKILMACLLITGAFLITKPLSF